MSTLAIVLAVCLGITAACAYYRDHRLEKLSWQLTKAELGRSVGVSEAKELRNELREETKRADDLSARLKTVEGDLGQCIDSLGLVDIQSTDIAGRARTVLAKIEPVQCTMCNGDRVVFNGDSEAACPACEGTHPE